MPKLHNDHQRALASFDKVCFQRDRAYNAARRTDTSGSPLVLGRVSVPLPVPYCGNLITLQGPHMSLNGDTVMRSFDYPTRGAGPS